MRTAVVETIAELTPMEWRIILLATLIVIGFWIVLAINSWARRLALGDRSAGPRRKSAPGPDAWSESGRRFRFESPNEDDESDIDDDDDEDDEDEDEEPRRD